MCIKELKPFPSGLSQKYFKFDTFPVKKIVILDICEFQELINKYKKESTMCKLLEKILSHVKQRRESALSPFKITCILHKPEFH